MASPAYIVPPKEPAYVVLHEASYTKPRALRRRPAKAKKGDQPGPDGKTLAQREEEARAWAAVHEISPPASLAEAVALYAECSAGKKQLRIFIAQCIIEDDCLRTSDTAKKLLLDDLKRGLLRAGAVHRASEAHSTMVLAFSQRLGIDKEAVKLRK